jgi:hypothetical protein
MQDKHLRDGKRLESARCQSLDQPLTDAELDRLEDFLCAVNAEEAMTLEEMDGLLRPLR